MTGGVSRRYTCLWCGTTCGPTPSDDLAALARLCPECLARAGDNPFLRRRLHAALEARARMTASPSLGSSDGVGDRSFLRVVPAPTAARALPLAPSPIGEPASATTPSSAIASASPPGVPSAPIQADDQPHADVATRGTLAAPLVAPPEDPDLLDDWYLGRGRYDRGPIPGAAWLAELDAAVGLVDAAGLAGRIVEPRCGVGFWSVLLASAGELTALDERPGMADRTTARLVAHGLRAHVHVTDPAAPPGADEAATYDGAFLGFTLSRLPAGPRGALVASTRARLRVGGRLVLVDLGRPGIDETHLRAALGEHLAGLRLVDAASAGPDLIVAVAERANA